MSRELSDEQFIELIAATVLLETMFEEISEILEKTVDAKIQGFHIVGGELTAKLLVALDAGTHGWDMIRKIEGAMIGKDNEYARGMVKPVMEIVEVMLATFGEEMGLYTEKISLQIEKWRK